MRALGDLVGRSYGPFTFRVSPSQVAAYVEATGDDPERWIRYAPPSFAGAVLFKAAPSFFADPDVASRARLLIHGDQIFAWERPWEIGSLLTVGARIELLRERGGTAFVTFVLDVTDDTQHTVLSSRSLFLMSSAEPPGGGAPEREEPEPEARRATERPSYEAKGEGSLVRPLAKSASRADLIRYAAASEDFNPVHWDHGRGVDSGVGGVICHGLLLAAWATQPAAASVERSDPLAAARFRFRIPLYPDAAATVTTRVSDRNDGVTSVAAAVVSEAGRHVVATISVRTSDQGARTGRIG